VPAVKDYYELLGVPRTASKKEIQAAFRKLARKHHPDVNQGDDARFKEISEAHSVLVDPEKRKLYDRFGADWQAAQAAGAGAAAGAGGAGPRVRYRTVRPDQFSDLFGGGEAFGDILGSIFGDQRSGAGAEPEGTIEITLPEAFTGTTRTISTGGRRRVEVKVPAGVEPGTVLRVPGLRVRIEVAPHSDFVRDGKDLRTEVVVPLKVALQGGEVEVPTLKGGRVNIKVAPQTQNGTRLRLRGLGMPDPRGGTAGDLYAEVSVRLPVPADEATRRWIDTMP
jgi:curved DNA-binding protein